MISRYPFASFLALAAVLTCAAPALAGSDNPECLGSQCGHPKEEGGGCGCGCGCSVWVAYTDDGKTLSYTDDADGDGKADDRQLPLRLQPGPDGLRRRRRGRRLRQLPERVQLHPARHRR